jgi:hypothetical protein
MAPFYVIDLMMSKFLLDITALEAMGDRGAKTVDKQVLRSAYRDGKALIDKSMKYAASMPESFRLMGNYHWIIGKRNKAFCWWQESMKAAEGLGCLPELGRTYLEVGRRLIETSDSSSASQRKPPWEYCEKAKLLFEKLKLEWDIKDLEEVLLFSRPRKEPTSGNSV